MAEQVPFINREDELAQINTLIEDWGTRCVLCINAEGGIGKTRLLQEIQEQYLFPGASASLSKIEKKAITIAVVHEFANTEWSKQFITGVKNMGADLDVTLLQTDAHFDLDQMAIDLESVILKSPDAIIIRLGSSEKIRPGIQKAVEQGINVLTLDNDLPRLAGLTTRVTIDEHETAYLSLDKLAQDINFHGKIAAVWIKGIALQKRRKQILDTMLQKHPDIELAVEFGEFGANMVENIYRQTKEVIRTHPDIKAIWVTWDEFTRGVVRALIEEKRTDILVYSFDLSPLDIDLMLQPQSPWIATVAINPTLAGRIMVRLAIQAAYGDEIKRHYSIPRTLITQEKLSKIIKINQVDKSSSPLEQESEMGWTPWLRSLLKEQPKEQSRLQIIDIIDFDDHDFHLPRNIGRKIAQMLDEKVFKPYLFALLDRDKMKRGGIGSDRLKQEDIAINRIFADCFNTITARRRVVWFVDTTDALEGTQIVEYLIEISPQLKNNVLLIAGRNAENIGHSLQTELNEDVQIIQLSPLETKASESYLQQKQEMMHITLEPDLVQKILLLAQGRPILIDLAAEWRAREVPLDWLVNSNLEELETLSDAAMNERRKEFEQQLVHHIADTRRPIDWLTLVMSRIYPLTIDMIIELKISKDQAEALFKEAQSYVFVKSLPDGRISLHDEMRRLINEYVWPNIDPDDNRRRRDSKLAVKYFEREIQTLATRIEQFEGQEDKEAKAEFKTFLERETLERKLWGLREQQLYHALFRDTQEGLKIFTKLYDEATLAYRYSFRKTILEQIQVYLDKLSPKRKYEIDIRQAKYLLDSSQYPEARELLKNMSKRPELLPDQKIDTYIQLANVDIRLGKLQNGIDFFKKAVQISQKHKAKEWLAKAENGLGWAYRLTSALKKAGDHYEAALELAIETGAKQQQALLYNNLGFVYAYYEHIPDHRDKAVWFCNQALTLWKELDVKRGQGMSYSTLGCIVYIAGQFADALSYFQKALEIFEPAQDREWLSTVYSWRGAVYMSTKNFELAERDLLKALDMGIQKDRPMNLSRLRFVYVSQNKLDEAQKAVDECRALALTLPDVLYQLVSLRDIAHLAFIKKEYKRLAEFEQLLDDYLTEWEARDLRALGMLYLYLGLLALGQSNLNQAIEHFKSGLKAIAQRGRYANDTPQTHLERLEQAVTTDLNLPPEQIREIGLQLQSFWRKEGLNIAHPDVKILLSRWIKWGEA